MSILMISHELEELSNWTHGLHVLYCGQMVESGPTKKIYKNPYHPYTQALLKSLPDYNKDIVHKGEIFALKGTIPTLQHLPIGCRLGPRCPQAQKECVKTPKLCSQHERSFACHFPLIKTNCDKRTN
jgi:cationic peptide transport system ATP-binding protein